LHRGLPEALHVPRQLSCSPSGVWCMGDIFSLAQSASFRASGASVLGCFQPVLETLGRCRRCVSPASKCCLASWRAHLRSAGFRRSFLLALSTGRVPPFFPLVAMVDLLMRTPQRIVRSMASITPRAVLLRSLPLICYRCEQSWIKKKKKAKWRMIRRNLKFPGLC
jgi:hypothetical protein